MKNKTFNILILLISTGIMLYFFVFSHGFQSLIIHLRYLDGFWIVLSLFLILMCWVFEAGVLHVVIKSLYGGKIFFSNSFRLTMIGQFFGAFTPFSSGSQPAQLYAMNEMGIPIGASGSILMIKFIIHEIVYLIYLIIAIIFKFSFFSSKINYFLQFCFFGFLLNISIILSSAFFSINNKMPIKIIKFITKILGKIKLIKNIDKKFKSIEDEFKNFHDKAIYIYENKKMCAYATLYTFLQWTAYYTIPYLIYRSFGFDSADIFTMITAQVFLTMFMSFIPIPGAEGGAEAGFYIIYGIFFKYNSIMPAIFIWRIITYYMKIVVGSIFAVLLSNKTVKIAKTKTKIE